MQHPQSAFRTYLEEQPQAPDLCDHQPFKAASQPTPTQNIAPRAPKRKATDQAQRPVSGPLNLYSLRCMPKYSTRPEMATEQPQQPPSFPMSSVPAPSHLDTAPGTATEQQPLSFAMSSAPIEPLAPNHLDTSPDVWRSRLEYEQPAPEAPPSKATAPPTRDLSGFLHKPQNPTNTNPVRDRGDLVQPLNDVDAATKTNYDPKTIARDILIASGRHPTEPCLNHHLKRLHDIFNQVDARSDLDTFRWDIVDAPGMQAKPVEKPVENPSSPVALSAPNRDPDSQQSHPANQKPPVITSRDSIQQGTPRSRPAAVRVSLPQTAQLPSTPDLCRQQQSSQKQSPASQPQSPQTQAKLRGGFRKEQSGEMVGTKSAPRIEVAIPESAPVPYPVYACEWKNCVSELHNLELLRKHVLKCHVPYTLTCDWVGCTYSDMMAAADLFEHVKTHHVGPLAWKLGDGPSAHRSGEETL